MCVQLPAIRWCSGAERGNEVRVGGPDEIRLGGAGDREARHEMVASALGCVVAAFEGDQAVDYDRRRDRVGRDQATAIDDGAPGTFRATARAMRLGWIFRPAMKLVVGTCIGSRVLLAVADAVVRARSRRRAGCAGTGARRPDSRTDSLWSARRPAPLRLSCEIGRVQGFVLQVFVADAVIVGGSGARDRVGDEAAGASVFGGVVVGRDAVFLHGFRRHGAERAGDQVVVVLDAVEQVVR